MSTPIYDSLVVDQLEAGLDLEIIEALDFEESTGCELDRCSAVATVLVVHNCCGFSVKQCGFHTEVLRAVLTCAMQYHTPIECVVCNAPDAPFPTILPLGGAS